METQIAERACSQCGRAAPSEPETLATWRHGELALVPDLDDVSARLLLCPDCVAEEQEGEYEEGGGA